MGSGGGRLSEEWSQLTLHFLGDSLDVVREARGGGEWLLSLGHTMLGMLSTAAMPKRLKACVLSLLGPLLARTPPTALLPHALPAMLASCTDDAAAAADPDGGGASELDAGSVRLGCAIGMGGAAGKRLAPDCGAAGIAGIAGIGGSGAVGAGIAVAGGNKLAPDIGSGTAGCIVIPPATGGGGSGRSSAGPSVANASIGVWVRVSVYWQRTGSNLRGRQPSAE